MNETVIGYARLLCEMVLEALRYAAPNEREYILEPKGPTKQAKNPVVVVASKEIEAVRERYEKLFQDLSSEGQLIPKLYLTRTSTGDRIMGELVLVKKVSEYKTTSQPVALAYVKIEAHHLMVH